MQKRDISLYLTLTFGNVVEWYDFSIFAYYAVQIGQAFFPHDTKSESILMVFLVFGIGFIARPVGGFLLGKVGDHIAHHLSTKLSIAIMVMASFALAILPPSSILGVTSVILLVTIRVIQGASAGGQFSGILSHLVVNYKGKEIFLSSIAYTFSILGFLLSLLVAYIIYQLNIEAIANNQWRVAMLVGVLLGVIYFILMRNVKNKPKDHVKMTHTAKTLSLKKITAVTIVTFSSGCIFFFVYTYLFNYINFFGLATREFSYYATIVIMVLACILYPLIGYLVNQVPLIRQFCAIGFFVFMVLLLFFFNAKNLIFIILISGLMVLAHAFINSILLPLSVKIFWGRYMMRASASTYNFGVGFSGLFPYLCHLLLDNHQVILFSLIFFFIILFGFISLEYLRRSELNESFISWSS